MGRKVTSIVLSLTTGLWLVGGSLMPFVAQAQTTADLQAQITALLAQIAALQAQLSGGGTVSSAACTFTRNLTVGSTGDDVMCLQKYLNSAGHQVAASGAGSPGSESKYFGSLTKAAVAKWQAANGVAPAVGYFGAISQAKYGSLVASVPGTPGVPGTPAPVPAPAGTLAVAAGTQPSASLFPGNGTATASNVPFTVLRFTAPAASDVTVNSLVVERTGLSSDAAFSSVVLLDEMGAQVGNSKTLNSTHQATLTEPFVVKAGTTRTMTLAGNAADESNYAGQVAFLTLVSVNSSLPVTGSLPITGAGHTVNASVTIGSVTMGRGPLDPGDASPSKKVGDTAYIFSSVKITAGSAEKVYLKSIRWNQTGSASASDLANIKTYVDGTAYDAVVSSDGKYYTSVFGDNAGKGILIDKGYSKEVYIKGDIAGGSGRTIDFDLAKRRDIQVVGETYGYGITPPQTGLTDPTDDTAAFSSTEDPWYDADEVSVTGGSITVANSNTVPAQNISSNLADQPLGAMLVTVKGEPISVGRIGFNVSILNGTADGTTGNADVNDLTNVTLVNSSGAVVAGPVDGSAADSANTTSAGHGSVVFSDTITFPVGENIYYLKSKFGTDIPNNYTIQASTTPSADWATVTGTVTGVTRTPSPTSAITLNLMTLKTGALTVSVSSNPIAQNVVAGNQGFTFANYIFDTTASGEDVRMTSVPLVNGVAVGSATDLTSCALYDGASTVTSSKDPSSAASTTLFTFTSGGYTFAKGTSKTLALKCNIASGATGKYLWGIDAAQNADFTGATGLTSGQTITETFNDANGQLMTATSGGSLAVVIDAGSPTYTIVAPGQTVELARIKFSATNEDIDLKRVAFELNGVASNTPDNLVNRQITLHTTDGTQIGTAVFPTGDYATSSLLSTGAFSVPRDGSKVLVVKGVIGGISVSGPITRSGEFLKVDYDADSDGLTDGTYGSGLSSGTNITPTGSDTASDGVRIMKAYPTMARLNMTSSLVNGINQVMRWSVTANNGDVSVARFTIRMSTTSVNAASLNVYAFSDSGFGNPITVSGRADGRLMETDKDLNTNNEPTTGDLVVEPTTSANATTTLTISSGQTLYFAAQVNLTNVDATGDATSFQLQGDAAFPVAHQAYLPGGGQVGEMTRYASLRGITDDDFLWSPLSTTTADLLTNDWTNGFRVTGLPTSNMTPQVLNK